MTAARASGSSRVFAAAVVAVVVLAVVAGLVLVGSPAEARKRRLDDLRIEHLRALMASVEQYQVRHKRLPDSLRDVRREEWAADAQDPTTDQAYEYRAIDSVSYELCAVFARPSDDDLGLRGPVPLSWNHPAGRHCFRRDVRP